MKTYFSAILNTCLYLCLGLLLEDLTQTQVIKGKFSRVLSWYDNEWGFSNRMCDTAIQIAGLI